jgi:DNA-binding transcriptional MocR family regulator
MHDWTPDLSTSARPRYLALADRIASDVQAGRLVAGDRLPAQRLLAARLGIDFTTVARGYGEAQKRGLVEARQGQGTFVLPTQRTAARSDVTTISRAHADDTDLSMNLSPEPHNPELIERMRAGWDAIGQDILPMLRYRSFGGGTRDKEAALHWLARRGLVPAIEQVYVTPGAHAALLGILSALTKPGDVLLSENLTYPGVRSVAALVGVDLHGLPMDHEGIDPEAFADACARFSPKALYLNPTLQNPTNLTISLARRQQIVEIARRFDVAIIEDDAYGFIAQGTPPTIASLAPDLTWYVASLAKCIGAGLRTAYVVVPEKRSTWGFASAVRSATVIASPITLALATRWIEDGTADAILRAVRVETEERQKLAHRILADQRLEGDPDSFNIWLSLPAGWTRSAFVGHMRSTGVGIVPSDAFTVSGTPPEAVRICLGGPAPRSTVERALECAAHALEAMPATVTSFL